MAPSARSVLGIAAESTKHARSDDVDLTAYETAAKAIFVAANGLQVYYKTYYKHVASAGWVSGSRRGDRGEMVWRNG